MSCCSSVNQSFSHIISLCISGELCKLQHQLEDCPVHEMERQPGACPERSAFLSECQITLSLTIYFKRLFLAQNLFSFLENILVQ